MHLAMISIDGDYLKYSYSYAFVEQTQLSILFASGPVDKFKQTV